MRRVSIYSSDYWLLSSFILHPSSFFIFTALTEIGQLLVRSFAFVGQASHDKEQVGEAIEILQRSQVDLLARTQRSDCAFGSPRHRPRQMESGSQSPATG